MWQYAVRLTCKLTQVLHYHALVTDADGDKISIFGFSRGAYTARALAGMLHKVGLLPAHNQAQIAFAYKWYKDDTQYGWDMSADFKRTFGIDVDVHFLACWDTVASVGMIPRILPFAKTNNTSVRYFRHALALDERRAKFKANHWLQRHPQTEAQKKMARERQQMEIEHAKRSAGAGRGVHVDQSGHVVSYGAFGSINLGDISKRTEEAASEQSESKGPSSVGRRASLHSDSSGTLRKSFASMGRRRSSIAPVQTRETAVESPEGSIARRASMATVHPSAKIGAFDEGAHEFRDEDEGQEQDDDGAVADLNELQHDKGTSKSKVKRSQRQIDLMKKFNLQDEMEWGRNTRETDVLEVWFSGCHADVGSGAVPNTTRHMISRIPLRWMIRQSFLCNSGILYRSDILAEHGLDVDTLWPCVLERRPLAVGPAPSDMDRYAQGKLPSLDQRRQLVRRSTKVGSDSPIASPALYKTPGDDSHGEQGDFFSVNRMNSFARKLGPVLGQNLTAESKTITSDADNRPPSATTSSTAGTLIKNHNGGIELDILPEIHEDFFDCQAAINDQLADAKSWWILELLPIKYRVKEKDGTWRKKLGPNLGRYRTVREPRPKMHWTVLQRQQLLGYEIKCHVEDDVIWDVVM